MRRTSLTTNTGPCSRRKPEEPCPPLLKRRTVEALSTLPRLTPGTNGTHWKWTQSCTTHTPSLDTQSAQGTHGRPLVKSSAPRLGRFPRSPTWTLAPGEIGETAASPPQSRRRPGPTSAALGHAGVREYEPRHPRTVAGRQGQRGGWPWPVMRGHACTERNGGG